MMKRLNEREKMQARKNHLSRNNDSQYTLAESIDSMENYMKMFKVRQAYREGLPPDYYDNENNEFNFECQNWPNDYTFI